MRAPARPSHLRSGACVSERERCLIAWSIRGGCAGVFPQRMIAHNLCRGVIRVYVEGEWRKWRYAGTKIPCRRASGFNPPPLHRIEASVRLYRWQTRGRRSVGGHKDGSLGGRVRSPQLHQFTNGGLRAISNPVYVGASPDEYSRFNSGSASVRPAPSKRLRQARAVCAIGDGQAREASDRDHRCRQYAYLYELSKISVTNSGTRPATARPI